MNREIVTDASPVVSWVRAVDDLNREELTRSCLSWTEGSTNLLENELVEQYYDKSNVGLILESFSKAKILKALSLLQACDTPKLAAMTAGLFLIDEAAG